jgi:hypothetical protein
MKLALIALTLFATHAAFAANIDIDCKSPAMFAGQASTMKGTLKTSAKPTAEGYYTVSGKLKVTVGGTRGRSLYDKTVNVRGVVLDDGAVQMISEKNPELDVLYANPNRKDVSYVELNGRSFISNCKQ